MQLGLIGRATTSGDLSSGTNGPRDPSSNEMQRPSSAMEFSSADDVKPSSFGPNPPFVLKPLLRPENADNDDDEAEEDTSVPKRQATPLEKDMWNQSLYLPREFENPPERPDPHDTREEGEENTVPGFPASPHTAAGMPVLKSPTARRGNVEEQVNQLYQQPAVEHKIGGTNITSFSTSVRRESEGTFKPLRCQRQRDVVRYMFTFINLLWFYEAAFLMLGVIMVIVSILLSSGEIPEPPESETAGVLLWRWMAFTSLLILSIPGSFLLVRITEILLWYSKPKWTTTTYYYVKCCRTHIAVFFAATGWVISWNTLIFNGSSNSENRGFFYGSQMFWLIFTISLLLLLARLARELSGAYFERTTFWTLVSDNLKREYYLFACCPGSPVPSPVVLTYHRMGEEAIRSDPRVLRQCTKYLRRHCITAYNNVNVGSLANPLANVNAPIEISQVEEMQDLGEVIFEYAWQIIHGERPIVDEDTTRVKLKAFRQGRGTLDSKEDTTVRALFSAGSAVLSRGTTTSTLPSSALSNIGETVALRPMTKPSSSLPSLASLKSTRSDSKKNSKAGTKISLPKQVTEKPLKTYKRITQQEFMEKMFTKKDERVISAEIAWATIFDPNKRGFCTPRYLRHTMIRFYNERVGLGLTLKDSQAAVDRLGWVYYSVAVVGTIVAAALLFAGTSSYDVWIGITSFFVTLAVVFGSTLKSIAENIVFIFFRHPYDVGDLLFIGGIFYSVRRLELLSTVLIKWNGQWIQRDNLSLSQMEIFNLSRSGLYWEFLEAHVDVAVCTTQFVNNVRQHLIEYINAHPDSFSGKFQMIARSHARPLLIRIGCYVEFAYRPVNLTKLFDDIGRINEAFAEGLRKYSATEGGVGLGAVRACVTEEPVHNVIAAHGLFSRNKIITEAVGL